jgi:hypothetical protein
VAFAVYWIAFAWYTDSWVFGILAGMFIIMAIDTSIDWWAKQDHQQI